MSREVRDHTWVAPAATCTGPYDDAERAQSGGADGNEFPLIEGEPALLSCYWGAGPLSSPHKSTLDDGQTLSVGTITCDSETCDVHRQQHRALLPGVTRVLPAGVMTVTLMDATNNHLNRGGPDMCAAVSHRRVLLQSRAVKLIGLLSAVAVAACAHTTDLCAHNRNVQSRSDDPAAHARQQPRGHVR
jgi:hypothetical protein